MDSGNADREAWERARTLEDLGELTARWLDGTLKYMPGYADEPDQETEPIRGVLAAANRRGLVTTDSQPGVPMDAGSGQRAAVEGYAKEEVARRLGALGLWTELLVFIFPPGDYSWGYRVPITVDEFHPFTWLGSSHRRVELQSDARYYSREALEELAGAWKVVIIDPRWGREWYLWEHLSAVLERRSPEDRFSVEPAPHLGLDDDLVF